jgi:serine/threonine protein kinase
VPFESEDPITIVTKHASEPPPSPKEVNPEVPEGMNALVLRLLSKDPEDRHGDATELIRDLSQVRAGFSTALLPAKSVGVPAGPEETQGAAPTIPGDLDGKLRRPRKERADILSAAVVYGRGEKHRRISPWVLAAASVAILAILLGMVGRNLIQNYTEQASVTSLQDTAQDPVDTPHETSEETEPAAGGGGSTDEKEAKAHSGDGPSRGKASSYTVSPSATAEQNSESEQVVAVPAALITQGDDTAPQATPVSPTPEADLETPTPPEADLETSSSGEPSQHIVVRAKSQKITGSEKPGTKKAKSQRIKNKE